MMDPRRTLILEEARSWLRTPYHHRARVKGAGVDCAQLPIAVYVACGLLQDFDPEDYPPDWMMHRSEERYLSEVEQRARNVGVPEPGDFALFQFGRCFSHGAIVVEWPLLIHANATDRCVAYGDGTKGDLAGRPVKFFSVL